MKAEVSLIQRMACSHSKCDTCKKGDVALARLVGKNDPESVRTRAYWIRAMAEHNADMLMKRQVLDDAGCLAIVQPWSCLLYTSDAADE